MQGAPRGPLDPDGFIYLDHAATTPMRPESLAAMEPWLGHHYGNPSGVHPLARDARRAIDEARDTFAELLGAEPGQIVFTGGGTEADNLAVLGSIEAGGGTVICSMVEHPAVRQPTLASGGLSVPVDERGVIRLDVLESMLAHLDEVALVSVMSANNEVGVVQPLDDVAEVIAATRPGTPLHTDAVHAFSWLDVAQAVRPADLVALSAHKFGGPQGVGVLVVRGGAKLAARQVGGGQERELRSGTQNVAGIVGGAAAARAAAETRAATVARVGELRDRLADSLLAAIPDSIETGVGSNPGGDRSGRVAGMCHLLLPEVESEALLVLLEEGGVCASAASSCASGAMAGSHVLDAMNAGGLEPSGSLRLSLGWTSSDEDVDRAIEIIPPAVARLRKSD